MNTDCKYIYGPVPSRRLGRSLGVDLVPYKTCSYDCIYCQLGRTTLKTAERGPYVATADIMVELGRRLSEPDRPDTITLAGSGEPTLNSNIGEIIKKIKEMTDVPVAVLTNGSLLWMDEVQTDLMAADLIIPSLDIGDARLFEYVNRPVSSISFNRMLDGLRSFTRIFQGDVWLEILLLEGVTAIPSEVKKIAELIQGINVTRIQLNTAIRPSAEDYVFSVPVDRLIELGALISGPVEIIRSFSAKETRLPANNETLVSAVVALLRRRPCTMTDVAEGLGIHVMETVKLIDRLMKDRLIKSVTANGSVYFVTRTDTDTHTTHPAGGIDR